MQESLWHFQKYQNPLKMIQYIIKDKGKRVNYCLRNFITYTYL